MKLGHIHWTGTQVRTELDDAFYHQETAYYGVTEPLWASAISSQELLRLKSQRATEIIVTVRTEQDDFKLISKHSAGPDVEVTPA